MKRKMYGGRCAFSEAVDGLLDNRIECPFVPPPTTTTHVQYDLSRNYNRIVGHAVYPYTSQHSHPTNAIRKVVDR
ncbi:MAG TPA: hypothetical protein VEG44_01040 [Candidatus Acidoferrales bacterium]|nr:hypothetical protein [Candidatus Acidoferrales bacterium]